jgi:hypothetical protein
MAGNKNRLSSDDSLSFLYTFLDRAHLAKASPINNGKNKSPILEKPLRRGDYAEESHRLTVIFDSLVVDIFPEILGSLKISSPYFIKKMASLESTSQSHFYLENSHKIIQAFCSDIDKALKSARSRYIGDLSAYMELARHLERPDALLADSLDDEDDEDEDEDTENIRENSKNTFLGFAFVPDLVQDYVGRCVLDRNQSNLKAFRADFYEDEIAVAYLTVIFGLIIAYLRAADSFQQSMLYLSSSRLPGHTEDWYMDAFEDEINARALSDGALSRAASLLGALAVACLDFSLCGMTVKLIGVRGSRDLAKSIESTLAEVVADIYASS